MSMKKNNRMDAITVADAFDSHGWSRYGSTTAGHAVWRGRGATATWRRRAGNSGVHLALTVDVFVPGHAAPKTLSGVRKFAAKYAPENKQP